MDIREITDSDIQNVVDLWEICGLTRPWNDAEKDIQFARKSRCSTVLVGYLENTLIASAMTGHDGHRGHAYYVSVSPEFQGRGYGRKIIEATEQWLLENGIWKINILIRDDNSKVIDFYKELGYEDGNTIQLGKRISE